MTGKTPSLPDIDKLIRDLNAVGTFNSITQEALREREEGRLNNLKSGDIMPDGTVFAGISPTTGKPMYALPKDESLKLSWDKAMDAAKNKEACGHKDCRVPDEEELNVLFNNRAVIGGFGGDLYWSSSKCGDISARTQRFSDGSRGIVYDDYADGSVRFICN